MQLFDASSMIYAWDNYPEPQFPPLWVWIANQIITNTLQMPTVALDEVGYKVPDCAAWLKSQAIQTIEINNAILQEAMRIKALLNITGDHYGSGVDENDLLIIAIAKINKLELVTEEARQSNIPKNIANMKIPAVCGLVSVQVPCINFVDLIKRSQEIFR